MTKPYLGKNARVNIMKKNVEIRLFVNSLNLEFRKIDPLPKQSLLSPNSTVLPGREKGEITLNFARRTFSNSCLRSARSKLISNGGN